MIARPTYLKKLFGFKDKQLIKILTGVRRCGKSTLFEMYQESLIKGGISKDCIHSLNLEDIDNEPLKNYKILYRYIKNRLIPNKMNYVFIDEIQNVADFEKVADSLFIKKNIDLYLTGSNSRMQSGQWAHYLPIGMLKYMLCHYLLRNIILYLQIKTRLI
ncbi:MAG: AAA family ATPase [Endomicrobium sp.]|jgi:predicted AAA+ superfamily ATPase|nr:AAA family ATPase [Endomicrobium sp.]